MIVSHVVANKKMCPVGHDGAIAFVCKSDECMAWRETGVEHKGFCGLAGRPIDQDLSVMLAKLPEIAAAVRAAAKGGEA